jgi:hypothetical protein
MNFIFIQSVIGVCSAVVAILSIRSFKRTGDGALKDISWAFLYFALHSFILVLVVSFYTPGPATEGFKLGLIFAKTPLFIGLLYLLRIPIIFQNSFIRNRYSQIITLFFLYFNNIICKLFFSNATHRRWG